MASTPVTATDSIVANRVPGANGKFILPVKGKDIQDVIGVNFRPKENQVINNREIREARKVILASLRK